MTPKQIEIERGRFEVWAAGCDLKRCLDGYLEQDVNAHWDAWITSVEPHYAFIDTLPKEDQLAHAIEFGLFLETFSKTERVDMTPDMPIPSPTKTNDTNLRKT